MSSTHFNRFSTKFSTEFSTKFSTIAFKKHACFLVNRWWKLCENHVIFNMSFNSFPQSFNRFSTVKSRLFNRFSTKKVFNNAVFSNFIKNCLLTNLIYYDIIIIPLLLPFVNIWAIFFMLIVLWQISKLCK